jgi:hypothetical protein
VGFPNGRGNGSPEVNHDEIVSLIKDSTVEENKLVPGEQFE